MKTKAFNLLIASVICISIVSCKKSEDDPTPAATTTTTQPTYSTSLSGFGSHGGSPTGAPYSFPSNVKVVGQLWGGDNSGGSLTYNNIGLGEGYVTIYFRLVNTNASSYSLTFPSGMIISRDNCDPGDSSQSGTLITPATVTLNAHDTTNICLSMYCINGGFHVSSQTDLYSVKVVSNNDQLNKLITALKNKTSLAMHSYEIQDMIWEISDGTGITQADFDFIATWN
jgi:hypothetical protein